MTSWWLLALEVEYIFGYMWCVARFGTICGALRDLVPFVQFWRFLNCTNGIKPHNAPHIFWIVNHNMDRKITQVVDIITSNIFRKYFIWRTEYWMWAFFNLSTHHNEKNNHDDSFDSVQRQSKISKYDVVKFNKSHYITNLAKL